MKANELRIGNYILLQGVTKPTQVWIIDTTEQSTRTKASPIPLTEEWLLKFGFEIKLDNFNWNAGIGINEIGDFKLALRHTDNFGWFYKSRCTPIKYVHQLQNLYFALTGEELTYGGCEQ
jgi:hypothetical protein